MVPQQEKAEHFLALHHGDAPLLMPNPWDIGSARILESLGFQALATTSSGYAATLGRLDGAVTARRSARARGGDRRRDRPPGERRSRERRSPTSPQDVAANDHASRSRPGLAGCSVEDYSAERGLYEPSSPPNGSPPPPKPRTRGDVHLVLTARAENHIRGNPDLADTIARLQSFQAAGADVLYAPGLSTLDDIRRVVVVGRPAGERAGAAERADGRRARRARA